MSVVDSAQDQSRRVAEITLEECRRHYGGRLVSVALFGSVARGVATPESDLDVLVVAEDLVAGRLDRVEEFAAVESRVHERTQGAGRPELSPVIKTPQEVLLGSPLFWDMTRASLLD